MSKNFLSLFFLIVNEQALLLSFRTVDLTWIMCLAVHRGINKTELRKITSCCCHHFTGRERRPWYHFNVVQKGRDCQKSFSSFIIRMKHSQNDAEQALRFYPFFIYVEFKHICWEANGLADSLAKQGGDRSPFCCFHYVACFLGFLFFFFPLGIMLLYLCIDLIRLIGSSINFCYQSKEEEKGKRRINSSTKTFSSNWNKMPTRRESITTITSPCFFERNKVFTILTL